MSSSSTATGPHWQLSAPGRLSLGELIALGIATILLLAGLMVWGAGELAGALFGAGAPRLPLTQLVGVLAHLPAHLAEPRLAWPAPARARLPRAAGMYGAAAIVIALATALLVAVRHLLAAFTRDAGSARGRGSLAASWGDARDLRRLRGNVGRPGCLTLGRLGGRLLAGEARQSAIVIAPTGALKTTGFAIPALLEWRGPALATSVKTDLMRETIAHRRQLGQVMIYDPTAATDLTGAAWTPLAGCGDWQGAQRTAAWLCAAARSRHGSLADADFWYSAAAKLLAPLLLAAAASGRSIADVVRWVDTQEREEVQDGLFDARVEQAVIAAEASWNRDDRQRSSIYTTAETVLAAYADPTVLACSQSSQITPDWLLSGGQQTLYLAAPAHEQQRLRPLFTTLIQQIITAVYERVTRTGRPLDPPLLVVLDEAANIAPIEDLDTLASTAHGQGIQLVSVFQDLAQIKQRWGNARAGTIVNNHRAKLIGAGVADPDTLDYAARVLGDQEIRQRSQTAGQEGHASTTESSVYRSLVPPHALRQAQAGSALLIYGNLPPVRLSLRPWFRDRKLKQLAHAGTRPQT